MMFVCFAGHAISVTTSQSTKGVLANMERYEYDCVSMKLYLEKEVVGWVWPTVYSLLTLL